MVAQVKEDKNLGFCIHLYLKCCHYSNARNILTTVNEVVTFMGHADNINSQKTHFLSDKRIFLHRFPVLCYNDEDFLAREYNIRISIKRICGKDNIDL